MSEEICNYYHRKKQTECINIRLSNSFGEPVFSDAKCWNLIVNELTRSAFLNKKIVLKGDGSPIRDFIHCRDVANGMIHMVENGVTTPVNLGSGLKTSIKDIATIISKYTNKPLKFNVSRNCGDSKRLMDMSRSTQCGFTPSISLEDGIIETIEWYREHVL